MLLKTERLTIRHIVADDWKSIKDIWVDFNLSEFAQYDKRRFLVFISLPPFRRCGGNPKPVPGSAHILYPASPDLYR